MILLIAYKFIYKLYTYLYIHINTYMYIIFNMNRKEKKFVELAEIRVNRALHDLKLIGNLGNKSRYISSTQQRNKIINSIKKAVKEMELNLNNQDQENTRWKL